MLLAHSALLPLLAFGGFWTSVYLAWRYFHDARAVADTPTAKIRSAPQGYVELMGQAMEGPEGPVVAHLSGTPCVWYRYRVEKRSGDGKWKLIDKGASEAPFTLRDDSGECVVYPKGARVVGQRARRWVGEGRGNSLSLGGSVLGTLRAASEWLEGVTGGGKRYRYTEQRIAAGTQLHALGMFRTVGGASELPDTRRALAELLESWKRDERRMAMFDRDGNGEVDVQEWDAAVSAATRQLDKEMLSRPSAPEVHTLARPSSSGQPFLLATYAESRLVRGFQLRMLGATAGLLASGCYLVWVIA